MKRFLITGLIAGLGMLAMAPGAGATVPGGVGLIAATSVKDGNEEIYSMDRDGGMLTRLTDDPARDFDPAFSPDGTKIAFVSDRDGGDLEIYVMDADGTDQTRLTDNVGDDMDPAWSPDGQRLAIRRDIGGDNEIFLIDASDGGNPVNLTQNPASDFAPDFSPDGTEIAFQRYTAGTGTGFGNEVMLMKADGTEQTDLTENDNSINDGRPSFSPDGTQLAFHSNRDGEFQIYTLTLADDQIQRVSDTATLIQEPAFSPDGSVIAAREGSGPAAALAIVDPADGTVGQITSGTGESAPSWQADDLAPVATIDAGPAEGSVGTETGPSFEFHSSEPGSTFECKLDEAEFAACESPATVGPLEDGTHVFSVRATDIAGNASEPVSRSFTVDTTAPEVEITEAPAAISGEDTPQFTFTADEPIAGAECDWDDAGWEPCDSPASKGPLSEGTHTFKVRATDLAGLTGEPVGHTWVVETTPPTATIQSGPENPTAEPNAWFHFTSENQDASFQCRIDPGQESEWQSCVSGVGYENLADGTHLFQVRAVGQGAGPGPAAEAQWTIDTVAPRLSVTARPASPTNQTDAGFEFEMNKPGFTFVCEIDAEPEAACASPADLTGLSVGDHSFLVTALDGNGEAVDSAHVGWTILADPPVAEITSGPGSIVASRASTLRFTADVPEAVFECSFDEGPWETCTSPAVQTSPADGAADFAVRAALPGEQPGPAATREWQIDTVAPSASIVGGPTGRVGSAQADFTVSVDDAQAAVSCRVDEGAWAACPQAGVNLTGLGDGDHVLRVMATDQAGNTGWARRDWSVDTTGPVSTIKSGPSGATTSRATRFSFVASEADSTFECRLDEGAWKSCTSPNQLGLSGLGDHRFEVRATDDLGNVGDPAGQDWTVAQPAPRGLKPEIKSFKRVKLNRQGNARLAIVKCPEGRCRVTAPSRITIRLGGRKFTPGVRSPRGFYSERSSEIMLSLSPGARKMLAKRGPVRIKLRLKIESDNGKAVTRSFRVTLTAR